MTDIGYMDVCEEEEDKRLVKFRKNSVIPFLVLNWFGINSEVYKEKILKMSLFNLAFTFTSHIGISVS